MLSDFITAAPTVTAPTTMLTATRPGSGFSRPAPSFPLPARSAPKPDDQVFQLLVGPWATQGLTLIGAIKLLPHQRAMPTPHGRVNRWITVSGWTIRSTERRLGQSRQSQPQKRRSLGRSLGRLTEWVSTLSCCRRARCSAVRLACMMTNARSKRYRASTPPIDEAFSVVKLWLFYWV